MRSLLRILKYFKRKEKLALENNRETVDKSNLRLFTVLLTCGIFLCLVLIPISFFLKDYASLRWIYSAFFVIMIFSLIYAHNKKGENCLNVYYGTYTLLVFYAAYSSAYITPEYVGIIVLLLLFEIPIISLDKTLRIISAEILFVVIYLAIVFPVVPYDLAIDEVINTISVMLVGNVTGLFFREARLKNLDLTRKLNVERETDVLTGLGNRRRLFEFFGKHERREIINEVYALAIIDIDDFKKFNDTYGHIAGDKCLTRIGKCFKEFGEEKGISFYRYGGEEFIAIVKHKPDKELVPFFEELNKKVTDLKIAHSDVGGYLSVSIGVMRIHEADSIVKFEQKINQADHALYRAKGAGKGCTLEYKVEVFSDISGNSGTRRRDRR